MFENPGGKVKSIGYVIFVITVIISILIAIFLLSSSGGRLLFLSFIVVIIGIFAGWLSSILLVAFGELVESSTIIREYLRTSIFPSGNSTYGGSVVKPKPKTISCSICGAINDSDSYQCKECGAGLGKISGGRKASDVSGGMKICPECNTGNTAKTIYCLKCGHRL